MRNDAFRLYGCVWSVCASLALKKPFFERKSTDLRECGVKKEVMKRKIAPQNQRYHQFSLQKFKFRCTQTPHGTNTLFLPQPRKYLPHKTHRTFAMFRYRALLQNASSFVGGICRQNQIHHFFMRCNFSTERKSGRELNTLTLASIFSKRTERCMVFAWHRTTVKYE